MKKAGLIIQREYFTRVRNRSFILSTILLPLFFIGFIVAAVYFSVQSVEVQQVAVQDHNGFFRSFASDEGSIDYIFDSSINADNFKESGYTAFLRIPDSVQSSEDSIFLISEKQVGMITEESIRDDINEALRMKALTVNQIDKQVLDSINQIDRTGSYNFVPVIKQGNKTEQSSSSLSYFIGLGSGFLIYITLFIYGAAVMRGVMEEKTNRIAEVIISSVKPFELMLGKIIGIALVGLTQLLIWVVLIIVLLSAASFLFSPDTLQQAQHAANSINTSPQTAQAMEFLNAKNTFLSANWTLIIPCFLFYFLGGYLFYAALFAAVGSVVNEDPQEAQALMLPITMPIILSFIIMTIAVGKPDAPIAVWGSIIPFSSPIIMMARIPSGVVPVWELVVSMLSLILGFILTTMLAAKIYRTGILLYGKKVSLKEMTRWLFRSS